MLTVNMHAWRIHQYGGISALNWEVMPVPHPAAGEVLVKIRAASVNPVDWKVREGYLRHVLPIEFPRVLGRDGAGEVVAVGPDVTAVAVGDHVLGLAVPGKDGTHAEFVVLSAANVGRIPAGVSEDAAVCLGIAGLSAYIPLVESAQLKAGERVLIHAGAGGVGGLAVQIAKLLGAHVVATCGTSNIDYVHGLGAEQVIDYTAGDFVAAAGLCDVVFDTMGGDVHDRSFAALKPGGRMVYLSAAPIKPPSRSDVKLEQPRILASPARLGALLQWAAERKIKPQVGRTFKLNEAIAAYELSQTGHARGKIVLLA